ncbi:putative uncharacterized protein [Rhodococcus sp. AW25M09]|nr:putative uncharacterized protein [Rhodococcus sp. AW25M09]
MARELPDSVATVVMDSAHAAFVSGMHVAAVATSAVLAVTAVFVLVNLRRRQDSITAKE